MNPGDNQSLRVNGHLMPCHVLVCISLDCHVKAARLIRRTGRYGTASVDKQPILVLKRRGAARFDLLVIFEAEPDLYKLAVPLEIALAITSDARSAPRPSQLLLRHTLAQITHVIFK